ncbi:MAG: type IV toxin-antitoxin system AbiEi family antitoxin domain-containing protein [Pseudonocardiaceae bacterium]
MTANRVTRASGLPPRLARCPFGVLRPADAVEVYANPAKDLARLADRGSLHKLATGYYAVVPAHSTDRTWFPSLEAATYGIAAADYGQDGAVLMGLSAARLHGAIPRALDVAVIAVPKNRPNLVLADRNAMVRFVLRDTDRLDAERLNTDLGAALVTTAEQTLLDLAHRPDLGGVSAEAKAAIRALWLRADANRLTDIAGEQRLRSALVRARKLVEA